MRLEELEPEWLHVINSRHFERVDFIEQADGIVFKCPKCWEKNGGPIGTHSVICWRPHVPQTVNPIPGRWEFKGTSFADLTLYGKSASSILLKGGCAWHGFITNGQVLMT